MDKLEPRERWLVPLLTVVGARPGMYLGAETVQDVECFIRGYASGRSGLGYPEFGQGEEELLRDFEHWLKKQLGRADSNLWWTNCIEAIDPSEHNARTFFSRWEEFLSEVGVSCTPEELSRFRRIWTQRP